MPRQSRIVLPNCPHHIIQRGHNRQTVFAGDDGYLYYLENLKEWKTKLCCRVYAYCLMTNHVHLVVDPGDNSKNLGRLMKRLAGRQTRYVNKLEKRSGSLWEGRYKSSPVSANEYLLACCRYVELNPLRAGMVEKPWHYRWSSCGCKSGGNNQKWLDLDPFYLSLGSTPIERSEAYKTWLAGTVPEWEWRLISEAIQRGQLTGNTSFATEVSKKLNRRIELRKPGRPTKAVTTQ